jgi:DNA replication initiation complex subunit (GINS family)
LPDVNYDDVKIIWMAELENESLQDLDDLKLTNMVAYLSKTRLTLAETPSDSRLQFELLTQEIVNLEFMIRDLLTLRRNKIINTALSQLHPLGSMTLAEEELYNRLSRGLEGHLQFVNDVLIGSPAPTMKVKKPRRAQVDTIPESKSDEIEYVLVRFLKPIEDAFLGIDDISYGPFNADDVATIPTANARIWLQEGVVTRVVINSNEQSG